MVIIAFDGGMRSYINQIKALTLLVAGLYPTEAGREEMRLSSGLDRPVD